MITTLNKLKKAGACRERYTHLAKALGRKFSRDAELPIERILEINGLDDALWALSHAVEGGEKICRLFAADCAERVLPNFLKVFPNDTRPAEAIAAARAYARGEIGDAALEAARAAAWAARAATGAAAGAAGAAAWAASWAARAAAWDAAGAARAAGAAAWAARDAWDDCDAEQKWQRDRLLDYLRGGAR